MARLSLGHGLEVANNPGAASPGLIRGLQGLSLREAGEEGIEFAAEGGREAAKAHMCGGSEERA